MAVSEKPSQNLMIRYLLGELSEEEQARVEERFLSDDECYEELLALENELKYDYAQGGLAPEERERFEKRFLRSKEDRSQLETAAAVLRGISERKERSAKTGLLWGELRIPQPLGWSLAAAALVLTVFSAWLLVETHRLRGRIDQLSSSQSAQMEALQKQANEERARTDRIREELENERRRQAQVKGDLPSQRPAASFVSLVLTPGLARDPGSAPKRLFIPPGTESVRVELNLRPGADYAGYRATLRTADGSEVLKRANLRASGQTLRLNLPARLLREGDYELVLEGMTSQRTFEEAGDYYFTVSSAIR